MRQPRILDVVRAVRTVAHGHREVSAWWYAPPPRLRLAGALPGDDTSGPFVELAIEAPEDCHPDYDGIGRELSNALRGVPVRARRHAGAREERRLFRLVSAGEWLSEPGPRADPANT